MTSERKYNCKVCKADILKTTFESNSESCYKCNKKIEPGDKILELVINTILGALAGIVCYFNFNIYVGIIAFFIGFFLGKGYNFINRKYDLE